MRWRALRELLRLGPSRDDLHAELERLHAEVETCRERADRADARAVVADGKARTHQSRLDKALDEMAVRLPDLLREPPQVEGCAKTRFHNRDEVLAYIDTVAGRLEVDPQVYRAYQCKKCPRHEALATWFWHFSHDTTTAAGQAAKMASAASRTRRGEDAAANGRRLGDRINPTIMAQLHRKTTG